MNSRNQRFLKHTLKIIACNVLRVSEVNSNFDDMSDTVMAMFDEYLEHERAARTHKDGKEVA